MGKTFQILASSLLIVFAGGSLSALASGQTVKCMITTDSAKSDGATNDYLRLSYHQTGADKYWIDSLQHIEVDPDNGSEKTEEWRSQSNRAGYQISYCMPDTNEVIAAIEKFNLNSDCVGISSQYQRILFNAYLSKRKAGSVTIDIFENSLKVLHRKIETAACN